MIVRLKETNVVDHSVVVYWSQADGVDLIYGSVEE